MQSGINSSIRNRSCVTLLLSLILCLQGLVWYGHVKRMSDDRWPKRALEYIPPSRRRRGRPAQTWMSGIVDTMRDRAIQENEWENRKVWRAKCEMRQKP
ncbi:hypothetical protein RN001_012359 [Aquatica leii]|uniref:Uncharacterized protein n=1 Tax=Aquatica leii TaxID=1421715 RepID=A0AAN7P3R0_9COLE|nr:hypothetical protein RN001_012359 [Aquatica leii]